MPLTLPSTNAAYKLYRDPTLTSEISTKTWANILRASFGDRLREPIEQLMPDLALMPVEDTTGGALMNDGSSGYDLVLTPGTMTSPAPGVIEKSGGANEWGDAQAYSRESYVTAVFVSWKVPATSRRAMLALNTDPETDATYTGLDFALYAGAGTTLQVYRNGAVQATFAYAAGDELAITYDGVTVRWWRNGELLWEFARAEGAPLYLDSAFFEVGKKVENVRFGSMHSIRVLPKAGTSPILTPKSSFLHYLFVKPRRLYSASLSIENLSSEDHRFRLDLTLNGTVIVGEAVTVPAGETRHVETSGLASYLMSQQSGPSGQTFISGLLSWELKCLTVHQAADQFRVHDIYAGPGQGVEHQGPRIEKPGELVRGDPIHVYFKNSSGASITNVRAILEAPTLDGARPWVELSSDPSIAGWKSAKLSQIVVREASLGNGSSFAFWVRPVMDEAAEDALHHCHLFVTADH